MKRYPNGVESEFFYEKNCPSHRPKWVKTAKVWSEGNNRMMNYCLAQDLPTLVWAANLADLELHTSLSRKNAVERPTMMVFDLDPGAPADIVQCCQVGIWLREILQEMKLQSWAKTSGSKGLQLYVPLNTAVTLRRDESAFACTRRIPRTRAFKPCSFEDVESIAKGKNLCRLESERRAQDDDLRLFAAREGRADCFYAGDLGGSGDHAEKEGREAVGFPL